MATINNQHSEWKKSMWGGEYCDYKIGVIYRTKNQKTGAFEYSCQWGLLGNSNAKSFEDAKRILDRESK